MNPKEYDIVFIESKYYVFRRIDAYKKGADLLTYIFLIRDLSAHWQDRWKNHIHWSRRRSSSVCLRCGKRALVYKLYGATKNMHYYDLHRPNTRIEHINICNSCKHKTYTGTKNGSYETILIRNILPDVKQIDTSLQFHTKDKYNLYGVYPSKHRDYIEFIKYRVSIYDFFDLIKVWRLGSPRGVCLLCDNYCNTGRSCCVCTKNCVNLASRMCATVYCYFSDLLTSDISRYLATLLIQ